jgi:L-ascorbate metabolism protein UlaG (beta-lactamase superfamily)
MRAAFRFLPTTLFLLLAAAFAAPTAWAACNGPIASGGVRYASFPAAGEVGLTFLGHASFLIESPAGVAIVTDYNGYLRPPYTPDIVTMNVAHSTHFTDVVEPGIRFVLRGWDPAGGIPRHDLSFKDVRVRNIPTNIRDGEATRYAANSMFVFDIERLCIVHLGHLHHTLTAAHLADLGKVDVLLAPVDGAYTMDHEWMVEVANAVHPALLVPMHYFTRDVLDAFLARLGPEWPVRMSRSAGVVLSRETLPERPEVLVLPGR